jgi:hypothetical protein
MLCDPWGTSMNETVFGALGLLMSTMNVPFLPLPLGLWTSYPSAAAS